jgi:hypothetical protein
MNELRCHRCSKPIGVYEPMVALIQGRPHETSLAAAAHPDALLGEDCFHRGCFQMGADDTPSPGLSRAGETQ